MQYIVNLDPCKTNQRLHDIHFQQMLLVLVLETQCRRAEIRDLKM